MRDGRVRLFERRRPALIRPIREHLNARRQHGVISEPPAPWSKRKAQQEAVRAFGNLVQKREALQTVGRGARRSVRARGRRAQQKD
eukprot:CAMPEP_0119357548 /NCGR_PEP_ID=MMETSP1334-20130426/5916_1 /TAXON_ID=127549 /ORGANISM="Calcidiscus leptoporus, Strain RCC1130" /LENGTH=85 /DNA_ID=CAMNT_0007371825 /DNA_START=866 /DNA_END=1123 /DNA_ORIENTATION=-